MEPKRIILVGPTCGGKTFLRARLESKGYHFDVSYTTREIRSGEEDGVHYHFITEDDFLLAVEEGAFYEHVQYNGARYGTGIYEWNHSDCFIMETDGIKHIKLEDRARSFIIYINTPQLTRQERMVERGWSQEEIAKRIETDVKKFNGFTDFDMEVTNPRF